MVAKIVGCLLDSLYLPRAGDLFLLFSNLDLLEKLRINVPWIVQSGGSFKLASVESSFFIVLTKTGYVSNKETPILGHCAPCP